MSTVLFSLSFCLGDRNNASNYKIRRRRIDPALYNDKRMKEKPFPATKLRTNAPIKQTSQQNKQPQNTMQCVTAVHTINIPPTPPTSPVHIVDQSHVSSCSSIDAMERNDANLIQPVHINDNDDVICCSDFSIRHRPIKTFDVLSGRHHFDRTIMNIRFH